MSDPKRLLTEGSDFERAMLEAWEAERPSAAARERVLAIVGAGAIVGIGATAAGSAGAAGAAVRGGASIAKWIAVGAIAIATTGATIAFVRHDSRHLPARPVSTHPASTPDAIDSPPLPIESASAMTAPAISDAIRSPASLAPAMPAKKPASPRASQKNDPSAANAASLNAQIAWLDRARRAIEAGDPATALHLLDDYRATYPEGTLSQEAELLRIEALLAGGQRAAAESLATRFIAAHPSSPHARRIRELVNLSPAP